MDEKPLYQSARSQAEREGSRQAIPSRWVSACLSAMLVLAGLVLLLFGVSWWTALVVILLLACPASIALAIRMGFQPLSSLSRRRSSHLKK